MKSTEIKYIELIRDLTHKKDFREEVINYRKKLEIPRNGFTSSDLETAFVMGDEIDLLSETEKPISRLRREYKNDKAGLEKLLQWKDLFDDGEEVMSILKRYQIPPRAAYMLHFFILYTPQYLKDIERKLYREGELRDYGCDMHYGYVEPCGIFHTGSLVEKVKKVKFPKIYDDLIGVICIYPEAKKSDVIRMIHELWDDKIKPVQMAQAKRSNLRIGNVRTKLLREKYDKIYRMHQKGLTSRQIAEKINLPNEGSWEYVRKAISIAKQRENKIMA